MRRRLLFIAFFFPPIGGVSVPRTLGHVRYLPAHGWDPVVITPRQSAYHLQDASLHADVPAGTRVIRTAILEPAGIRRRLRRVRSSPGDGATRPITGPRRKSRLLERMRRLLFFPDDQIGWLPFAVLAAIRAHRHRPADAILSSSSPVTAHLVAGVVAQALHVAWVAEFRDPWIGNALAHPAPWFHRVLGHRLEHWIVSTADRSVFVTPSLTELYRRRYPALASRFSTVTNGYDLDRRGQPAPWRSRSPVSLQRPTMALVYAGTLDRPAELRTFLDGLQLYDRRRGSRPRVQVEFIGHVSDACERILRTSASRLGPNVVTSTEFVPRDTVRERLRTADGALVMLGDGPGMGLFVGGKLYAYLGEDCPIVAMLPHGDARNLLESLGWGIVAMPEPESVAEALERFVSEHNHRVIADPERRFERSRLVAQLASVLDSAAAEND